MATTAPMAPRRAPPANTRRKLERKSASTYTTVCDPDCLDVSNGGGTCESTTREGQSSIRGCKLGDIFLWESTTGIERNGRIDSYVAALPARIVAVTRVWRIKCPIFAASELVNSEFLQVSAFAQDGNRNFSLLAFSLILFYCLCHSFLTETNPATLDGARFEKNIKTRDVPIDRRGKGAAWYLYRRVLYARRNGGFAPP